ncbi:MAG: hypothetical protein ACOC8K_08605, partial [Gemmatimonadota bacterium]
MSVLNFRVTPAVLATLTWLAVLPAVDRLADPGTVAGSGFLSGSGFLAGSGALAAQAPDGEVA